MNIQTRIALLTTQIKHLYADNEFCQHEEEIEVLETQLKTLRASLKSLRASYRTIDGTTVQCSLAELAERLDKPVESCPTFWDFSETASVQKPVQKPVKKPAVVCAIAAKLTQAGVKNPMNAAWNLHRTILAMLDCIRCGNDALFLYLRRQVCHTLSKHGLWLVDLIPMQTATLICYH